MRRGVMEYYGITGKFHNAGFYESEQHRQILNEVRTAVQHGRFVVLSGMVGCGKTTTLNRLREQLGVAGDVIVAQSLALDKERVNLNTLMLALFYDLSPEKNFVIPTQSQKREHALLDLIRRRKKPVALFIDDAHDLPGKTLVDLMRLMERVRDSGGLLSVVLAGHPRLTNELRQPAMEEAGSRATVFFLDNMQGGVVSRNPRNF